MGKASYKSAKTLARGGCVQRLMRRCGYFRRPAVEWLMRRSYQRGRDDQYVEEFMHALRDMERNEALANPAAEEGDQ